MMAAEGRCKALDAAADGYVRSESAVSALLHPISSTEEAATGSWAVLLAGTAVNQGGRSSTLTAPSGPSQQAVIRAALEEAELAPASITTLSMHGTGELQQRPTGFHLGCAGAGNSCPASSQAALYLLPILQALPWAIPLRLAPQQPFWWRARMLPACASPWLSAAARPGWATLVSVRLVMPQCLHYTSWTPCSNSSLSSSQPCCVAIQPAVPAPHAEPASGMVGFAHAAMALGGSYSLALLHLRHMNPYVVTSMKVTGEMPAA